MSFSVPVLILCCSHILFAHCDKVLFHFSNSCLQVLDNAIETEKMIEKYESLASDLLEWIEQTIIILNNRKFANSLVGVQQQLQAFNTYRTVEKPPK